MDFANKQIIIIFYNITRRKSNARYKIGTGTPTLFCKIKKIVTILIHSKGSGTINAT
jgi:hypothetical protein